jgi:hypothetical protein
MEENYLEHPFPSRAPNKNFGAPFSLLPHRRIDEEDDKLPSAIPKLFGASSKMIDLTSQKRKKPLQRTRLEELRREPF